VIGAPAAQANVSVRITAAAVAVNTPVTVTSSDESVARVINAPTVLAGQQVAPLTIATGNAGVAVLTVRAGNDVRTVLVVVGSATADDTLAALAPPAGISVAPAQSGGQLFAPAGARQTITIRLLSSPATVDTPITVTSSNPSVAAIDGAVIVRAGSQVATLTIVTGAAGVADLFFAAGGQALDLTVVSGGAAATPSAIVAPPVGVAVSPAPSVGRLIAAAAGQQTIGVRVLASPAAADTPVIVSSTNPAVASVFAATTVAVGQQVTQITITTGTSGMATLTLTAGTEVRELTVVVGGAGGETPATIASPVGVAIPEAPLAGVVISPVGAVATIGVRLLGAPATADVPVSVTTSDPNVASVQGPVLIRAGQQVATISIGTAAQGAAELTVKAGAQTIRVTVIAGTPPDGTVPVIVAPIVGVQIQKP
jgi:hypothetical protein